MTAETAASESFYLALGSNLGDRAANLRFGLDRLAEFGRVGSVSSFYETAPVGNPDQPDFLNAAAQFSAPVKPIDLLNRIKEIERAAGRDANAPRWSARPLDIDILLCGGLRMSSDRLVIPHPRMAEREFVLAPLAEIAPDVVIPGIGKPVRAVLDSAAALKQERVRVA